jgi:hypothetical protein
VAEVIVHGSFSSQMTWIMCQHVYKRRDQQQQSAFVPAVALELDDGAKTE